MLKTKTAHLPIVSPIHLTISCELHIRKVFSLVFDLTMKSNLSNLVLLAASSFSSVSGFQVKLCVEVFNKPVTRRTLLRGLAKGGGGKKSKATEATTEATTTTTTATTPATTTSTTISGPTTSEPIVGAIIKCYDSDWGTDDPVGAQGSADWSYVTDESGCVVIEDNQWWFENPDYYCTIENNLSEGGKCFQDTATVMKLDYPKYTDVDFGTIALEYEERYCGDLASNTNGCGPASIPDDLSVAMTDTSGFGNQCAVHDNCYDDCSKDRSLCDTDFLNDMLAICAGSSSCETLANLFYSAVVTGGETACVIARNAATCGDASLCYH